MGYGTLICFSFAFVFMLVVIFADGVCPSEIKRFY